MLFSGLHVDVVDVLLLQQRLVLLQNRVHAFRKELVHLSKVVSAGKKTANGVRIGRFFSWCVGALLREACDDKRPVYHSRKTEHKVPKHAPEFLQRKPSGFVHNGEVAFQRSSVACFRSPRKSVLHGRHEG